jgi:ParB/RepB/Spo0J family partition protein
MDAKYELPPVEVLPLADIDPDENQPRTEMTDIDELAASIAKFGLRNPISVRKVGSRYRIIGGERRYTAVRSLGSDVITAYVAETDDAEAALLELVDNQHVPLTEAEKSRGAQRAFVFEADVEKVAAATGYGVDVVARARAAYKRVNDPLKTETMSFEHLAAIEEFGDDEKAYTELVNATEAQWGYTRDNLIRERNRRADIEIAKVTIEDAGVALLTTRELSPEGYSYLERTKANPKKIPEGAIAARIEAFGSVSITWFAEAGEDPQKAAEDKARAERDALKDALSEAHGKRLAFIASSFQLSPGMKKLAERHWESGGQVYAPRLKGTPLESVSGLSARVMAAALIDLEESLQRALLGYDDKYNGQWTVRNCRGAVALLAELETAGYEPDKTEASRIAELRELAAKEQKLAAAEENKQAEEKATALAALPAGASCATCAYEPDCDGDELCEAWEAVDGVEADDSDASCQTCGNLGEVCEGSGDGPCDDYTPLS